MAYCVGIGVGRVPPNKKTRADILSRPKVGQWASQNMHQSRWAAYAMGIIHLYGLGEFKKDNVASMEAFQVGYRMKCPICTTCLAICYRDGDGVKKDDPRAVALLQEAISDGSVWAKLILGVFYEKGRGVKQDYSEAFQLYSDAAEHFLFGVREKARCFELGIGVEKDFQKAMELYQKASDAGNHTATIDLAVLMSQGSPKDKENLVAVLERGVRDLDAACTCILGLLFIGSDGKQKIAERGRALLETAADLDYPLAYFCLSVCTEKGIGVSRDKRRAIQFYKKAAALQDEESTTILGLSYLQGLRGLQCDNPHVLATVVARHPKTRNTNLAWSGWVTSVAFLYWVGSLGLLLAGPHGVSLGGWIAVNVGLLPLMLVGMLHSSMFLSFLGGSILFLDAMEISEYFSQQQQQNTNVYFQFLIICIIYIFAGSLVVAIGCVLNKHQARYQAFVLDHYCRENGSNTEDGPDQGQQRQQCGRLGF